jgi:hypothetical protein
MIFILFDAQSHFLQTLLRDFSSIFTFLLLRKRFKVKRYASRPKLSYDQLVNHRKQITISKKIFLHHRLPIKRFLKN